MNQNIVCWFEIYVDDMDRAKTFYNTVFGIEFVDAPAIPDSGDYRMSFFSDPENQGVNGALVQSGEPRAEAGTAATVVYFPSYDCTTEENRVEAAGGSVLVPKMSLGEFGACSICTDTEGNRFGIFSQE